MSKKNTQEVRLLEYLQKNKKIDPLQSWRLLGIYRLSAVIFILRESGHEIVTERKTVINSYNEECVVAEYNYFAPEDKKVVQKDLFS